MERVEPRPGSQPEGEGFGKPWVVSEKTFLGSGALVRSILHPETGRGLVAIDVQGRWNKTSDEETLSVIVHRDVAEEWARYMLDAVAAAGEDEAVWRARQQP